LRCLKAAARHGHADLQGTAYHDLFLTELETGAGPECEVLAENALAAFGSNSGAIARLAFDVAYHWILLGRFAAALRVAQALSPYFDGASEQALVLSMIARSAGGVGDRATFAWAAGRLNALLQSGAGADSAPRALLGLAYGAASLADWQAALGFVQGAIEAARERSEGRILIMAEAALDSIQRHAALEERGAPAAGVSSLAERFVDALAAPAQTTMVAV
jgi:hypothetical protein